MAIDTVIQQAQNFMAAEGISGWLLYEYRGLNPIFWDTLGPVSNVTRPCWLWMPAEGEPQLIVSFVDHGRFAHIEVETITFVNRQQMTARLREALMDAVKVAMEYSPNAALPRVSRIDAGTKEFVTGLGVEIVSSADLLQYASQRWDEDQLKSHEIAAQKLSQIVNEAFDHIGASLASGITEYAVAEFIRGRFREEGLVVTDGPAVAVNEHASDPHFDPTDPDAPAIKEGDWVLIDLWARLPGDDSMFGDITWTAYVGDKVPAKHREVFDAVIDARDAALDELEKAHRDGRVLEGWELDKVAREHITRSGYAEFFNHRLGHSLGREVHSNAVNLDGWETRDTRKVITGIGLTIEPGIYLPEFGVRSEIDVFMSKDGPVVTTEVQREIVLIRP
ncbi:MAG: M24 family metallopeptidase [SAR202 cluster bacterium]|nr:M24 family metallopeptidase [SAR202 cluster bacterium]MDP7534259.1 M24 family metallopeptidase [SAR202 cluster bacterium]